MTLRSGMRQMAYVFCCTSATAVVRFASSRLRLGVLSLGFSVDACLPFFLALCAFRCPGMPHTPVSCREVLLYHMPGK